MIYYKEYLPVKELEMYVNFPPTEPMDWASGVIDSPNGNASSRFCFVSDCIPQPDNTFHTLC